MSVLLLEYLMSIHVCNVTPKHALANTNCIMILRKFMFLYFSTYVMIIWLKYCRYGRRKALSNQSSDGWRNKSQIAHWLSYIVKSQICEKCTDLLDVMWFIVGKTLYNPKTLCYYLNISKWNHPVQTNEISETTLIRSTIFVRIKYVSKMLSISISASVSSRKIFNMLFCFDSLYYWL